MLLQENYLEITAFTAVPNAVGCATITGALVKIDNNRVVFTENVTTEAIFRVWLSVCYFAALPEGLCWRHTAGQGRVHCGALSVAHFPCLTVSTAGIIETRRLLQEAITLWGYSHAHVHEAFISKPEI